MDINTPSGKITSYNRLKTHMSSVLWRILISMISTNIIFYDFYNLYGSAKNIYKYMFSIYLQCDSKNIGWNPSWIFFKFAL